MSDQEDSLDALAVDKDGLPSVDETSLNLFKEAKLEETNKIKTKVEPVESTEVKPELTEIEKEAISMGWKPKDQFDEEKAGKPHISAEEYVNRTPIYKKRAEDRAKIKELETVVHKLGDHLRKTSEAAYTRALETLNAERAAAFDAKDAQRFNQVEARMQELYTEQQVQQVPTPPIPEFREPTPDEIAFATRNKSWFNTNPENADIVAEAVAADQYWAAKRPELANEERLLLVEGDIKRSFPDMFVKKASRREEPPAVAQNIEKGSVKRTPSHHFTDQQKQFGTQMVNMGIYKSLDEYAKDLDLQGALKK